MSISNLLITGPSGAGKSTLLRNVCCSEPGLNLRGFISDAIVEDGQRVGWRLDSLHGEGGVLAHIALTSPLRMGKYGVDLGLLERLTLQELQLHRPVDAFVVDEIGIIASWSEIFQTAFDQLLDNPTPLIAALRQRPTPYGERIRHRSDVEVRELNESNRTETVAFTTSWMMGQCARHGH